LSRGVSRALNISDEYIGGRLWLAWRKNMRGWWPWRRCRGEEDEILIWAAGRSLALGCASTLLEGALFVDGKQRAGGEGLGWASPSPQYG